MKYINKIFSLFAIALMAVACDPDAESYTPGGLEEGNQGICFAGNYTQTVEVEPGVTSFILTLKRSVTDAAGSVDIKVLNNEENMPFYSIICCRRGNYDVDCGDSISDSRDSL